MLEIVKAIGIKDEEGNEYYFVKPDFYCDLLKVSKTYMDINKTKLKYISIICHVKDEYDTDIALSISPEGYVFDGRKGYDKKFALTKYKK